MLRLENCPASEDEAFGNELKSGRVEFAERQYARRRTAQELMAELDRADAQRVRSRFGYYVARRKRQTVNV
jgi:hypothetical protein